MISVQNVRKYFGSFPVLKDISFHIKKGEIVGFLGPNGAGKTTLMRILTTYLPCSSGRVLFNGHNIAQKFFPILRKIGYLPETPPLYGNMTVKDYLLYMARMKDVPARQQKRQMDFVLEDCSLGDVANKVIAHLSKGFRQRVGIAQAMINDPEWLILDEPTSGLDPLQRRQVLQLIQRLESDRTVIVSTHNLLEIERVVKRVIVIKSGKILADDTLDHLTKGDVNASSGRSLEEVFLNLCAET